MKNSARSCETSTGRRSEKEDPLQTHVDCNSGTGTGHEDKVIEGGMVRNRSANKYNARMQHTVLEALNTAAECATLQFSRTLVQILSLILIVTIKTVFLLLLRQTQETDKNYQ